MNTKQKIAQYASMVIIATIVSRVLGLFREIVISNYFGASVETDAFFVAFMIPNLLRSLLGEGGLNSAFIPIFTEYLTKFNKKRAEYLASNVMNILIIVLIIIIVIGIWTAPLLIKIIALGFKNNPYKFELAVNLTRTIFPYIGLVAIASLFMSILNSYENFFIPALSPGMLNLAIIFIVFLFSKNYGIYSLALGVILGGIGQGIIQIPQLLKNKFEYKLIIDFKEEGLFRIFNLLLPVILGLGITQINVVVDRTIASTLIDGSISALYYANRLVQFPLGAFGIAISTAVFPTLSKFASNDNLTDYKNSFLFSMRLLLYTTIPSTFGLIVLRNDIIRFIYEHGLFDERATIMTANALLYYSLGLFAYAGVKLITMAFYALKDSKSPVKIGIIVVIINIILDLIFVRSLAHSGLALATSISAVINVIILLKYLKLKIGDLQIKENSYFIIKTILASTLMAISCNFIKNILKNVLDLNVKINQGLEILILIIISGIIFIIFSYLLNISEIKGLKKHLNEILRGKNSNV